MATKINSKEADNMKKLKNIFAVRKQPIEIDVVLLAMRLVVGYAFIQYGSVKIQNPMAWMGPESAVPGIFQALAALSEAGGGVALILGLVTRLASFGIACTMIGAVIMHAVVMGDPFINMTGGSSYSMAAIYLLIAILFVVMGPGKISVDKKVFGIK
jgi:putative oxidoreductase